LDERRLRALVLAGGGRDEQREGRERDGDEKPGR
jgi:hypothetical protein